MISVIIPAYNAEKTIGQAILSLLEGNCRDFEIIVSDDGSRDGTLALCRGLGDPRIRLLEAAENGGVSRARNRAIQEARGEYISFLDADDTVTPDYLESLLHMARAHGLDWTCGGFSFVDEKDPSRVVMEIPQAFERDSVCTETEISQILPGKILFNGSRRTLSSACGSLYRRDLLMTHGIRFREGLRYGEDTSFNLFYGARCRSLGYVAREMYLVHQHEGSTTENLFHRYSIEDFARLTEVMEDFRRQEGWPVSRELTNFIGSQAFGFLNHNACLAPENKRRAYYEEFDERYWSSPTVLALWQEMKAGDMEGFLQQIRFRLIKARHYESLNRLQQLVRRVRNR